MKAENKFIATSLLVVVIMFSLLSFKGGEKQKTVTVTETKCFVNQEMSTIKIYIDSYTKQGYSVKQIESQNISVSGSSRHDVKGDIILVLEKTTTVTVTTK